MSLLWLSFIFLGAAGLRVAFVAVHWSRLESLWYDLERRGSRFQLARAIDWMTFLGFSACAAYALWHVNAGEPGLVEKYAKVFVVWLGASLLARMPVHRFPRTNQPQLFADAKIALFVHLLLSVLGAAAFTAVTALWLWLRG